MSEKKRNTLYWLFKIAGIFISCLLPIWAIYEKYPIWKATYGTGRSLGTGGLLIIFVVIVVARKTIFEHLKDRFRLRYAPPIAFPAIALIITYALMSITLFLRDMSTVFWMWLIGCAIGTFLTFIAENRFGKDCDNNG